MLTHRAIHRMAHNPYLLDTLTQSLDLSLRMWNLARSGCPTSITTCTVRPRC